MLILMSQDLSEHFDSQADNIYIGYISQKDKHFFRISPFLYIFSQ